MKLPLWRLILALLVLLVMGTVLLTLAPVYLEDYQLRKSVRELARRPRTSDDELRASVLGQARRLDLPVRPDDISITHPEGRLHVEMKYAVEMNFPLYQVDLHFHSGATN